MVAPESTAQPIAAEQPSVPQQPTGPTPAGLTSPNRKNSKAIIGKRRTADEAAQEVADVHEDAPAPKRKCTEVKPFSFATARRALRPVNEKTECRASETRGFAGVPRVEKKQPTQFVPFARMERAVADYSTRQKINETKRFELGL
eukprot:NODE_2128_length_645_cov_92.826255_g2078_i0.p1 GENE.NODE_2128_length_645_cov_92.826255_g2078_i0~~NODE_2128_length_645_cov_92.826255_g2078_i0.p1  ORF type:complete len:145 (-),score=44.04 NODE_2128_length_645_cov_92.826255_g2078_i0:118-552(-)